MNTETNQLRIALIALAWLLASSTPAEEAKPDAFLLRVSVVLAETGRSPSTHTTYTMSDSKAIVPVIVGGGVRWTVAARLIHHNGQNFLEVDVADAQGQRDAIITKEDIDFSSRLIAKSRVPYTFNRTAPILETPEFTLSVVIRHITNYPGK